MKVFVLTWDVYVLGTFTSKNKLEEAIDYYSKIPILGNDEHFDFEFKEILLDEISDSMLKEMNDDGIFDMKNTVETFQNKSRDYLIKIFFLFVIACTILGFATFMKWLFHL